MQYLVLLSIQNDQTDEWWISRMAEYLRQGTTEYPKTPNAFLYETKVSKNGISIKLETIYN